MATVTLYDAYVPYVSKFLDSVDSILNRTEAHGKENGIDVDAEYLEARLHDDMWPLVKQVNFIADAVPWLVRPILARAGHKDPAVEGGDAGAQPLPQATTFADLHARVAEARELLQTLKPEHVNDLAEEVIDFKIHTMSVKTMLTTAIVPNLFFHVVTVYDILRSKGVPLAKRDYLTPFFDLSQVTQAK